MERISVRGQVCHGVIVLRIRPQTELDVHAVLINVLTELSREQLQKRLVVVDRTKYRIRSSV
jgi:hypothetical protein